jgi:hypothetical protein
MLVHGQKASHEGNPLLYARGTIGKSAVSRAPVPDPAPFDRFLPAGCVSAFAFGALTPRAAWGQACGSPDTKP